MALPLTHPTPKREVLQVTRGLGMLPTPRSAFVLAELLAATAQASRPSKRRSG